LLLPHFPLPHSSNRFHGFCVTMLLRGAIFSDRRRKRLDLDAPKARDKRSWRVDMVLGQQNVMGSTKNPARNKKSCQRAGRRITHILAGWVAEWFKAAVLKTAVGGSLP
jgi:hypothetical protein